MADSMAALATIHTVGKQTRRLSKLSRNDGDFSTGPHGQDVHEMKASEFLREAEASKRLVEKLQKERSLSAQCRKNGWTDISGELEEFERVLHQSRDVEKMTIQNQLEKIHNGVKKFQRQITDVKPTAELIGKLKEIMTEVEISINTFKEDHRLRFEELLKEERICYQEIAAYEKKLETWTLVIKLEPKLHPAPLVKVSKPDGDIPSEVRALESFLQKTGGPYGGWDQYDHQAFLKVWTKHSGRPFFRKEAKLYLPGKSLEEIEQHKEWYQELNRLQDKKREAIQQWKASKQQERQARIQSQEEAHRRERENKTHTQQHRAEEERREAACRLEEWREQQRKKEQQIQEQRLAEEIYQMRQAKEERRRQLEVKLAIEEQLGQRREEEEAQERSRREEEQRQLGERRKVATMGIKRFQERDLHKVEKKIQERQLSEQQEMEKQKRIAARIKEKVEVHISRNPSRLTQPTKGWEERMKHIGPSGGGPVLHMFHRAVPSWRQGL